MNPAPLKSGQAAAALKNLEEQLLDLIRLEKSWPREIGPEQAGELEALVKAQAVSLERIEKLMQSIPLDNFGGETPAGVESPVAQVNQWLRQARELHEENRERMQVRLGNLGRTLEEMQTALHRMRLRPRLERAGQSLDCLG